VTFILLKWVKYYTKEMAKALGITLFGAMLILLSILIKFKPVYEVDLSGERLGYIQNKENIEENFKNYIEDTSGNVAFKEQLGAPEYEFKLINRDEETNEEEILLALEENIVKTTYKTYAVTVDGSKQAIVSTEEEAAEVIEIIKSDVNSEEIGLNIGIVEEYSDDLNLQSRDETFDILHNIKLAKVNEYNEKQEAIRQEAIRKEAEEKAKAEEEKKKAESAVLAKAKVNPSSTGKAIAGLNLSKPVSGTITSRYGAVSSRRSSAHTGLDIGASMGTPVTPICSGTVTFAGWKGSYGNLVIVNHGNGIESYYAHCNTINVSVGQAVEPGTVISTVGSTGNSTGPHLHVEIRQNGTPLNPENYLY